MSRIKQVSVEEAKGEVKEIYHNLEKKMGKLYNIFSNMGHSPAVLKGYLGLNEAANQTSLSPGMREQIALLVGETNHCRYCLSAHTTLAKGVGLVDEDILKARQGESPDPKSQAMLKFAKAVVDNRGHVSNQDVASLKAAGVNEKEFVELILVIMVNMFTNYFNLITDPQIDFAVAPELIRK